ncbi:hypothetical protein BIW11_10138, partial [Tropilaelaps mercedesae]
STVLRDDNLEDDIQCVNKIFRRHGFHAWMMFTHKCSGNTLEFYNGCDIKNRKGPLPRYETQASTVSKSYSRPNRTAAEDVEPSGASHERYQASAEESIHSAGGDFSSPPTSHVASAAGPAYGYGTSIMQKPDVGAFYRQATHATLSQTGGLHLTAHPVVGGAAISGQNLFLASSGQLGPQFASPLTSTGLGSPLDITSPLPFGHGDLSLLSSAQLLTPQASQLTPLVHPKAFKGPTAVKAKPGVIQRLQGALRPPFRVRPVLSLKGLGRSGRQAAKAQTPSITGDQANIDGLPLVGYQLGQQTGPLLQMVPFSAVSNRMA